MERTVRLMAVLSDAGDRGVDAATLVGVAGFEGKDAPDQLNREFRHLRAQGWQIDNIAGQGEQGRFRLVAGDNRLRVALTPPQQAALQRDVLIADRADLVDKLGLPSTARRPDIEAVDAEDGGEALSTLLRALQRRATVRFRYKGRPWHVHPAGLKHQNVHLLDRPERAPRAAESSSRRAWPKCRSEVKYVAN